MRGAFFTLLIGTVALLGGFLFGLDIGSMTGSVPLLQQEFSTSSGQMGLIVGASLIGSIFGSFISAPLSNWIGRKTLIALSALFYAAGAFGLFFSEQLNHLFLYRLLIGAGIGIAAFAIPIYVAELAPKNRRGALVSVYQFSITLGVLSAFFVGYLHAQELVWRPLFGYNGLLALFLLAILPFYPKSRVSISHTPWNLVARYKKPLGIGIGMALFQQLTGINGIIFFAPGVLQHTGVHDQGTLLLLTSCIGVANCLSTLACITLIDRVGRRPMLFFGLTGMAFSLLFLFFLGSSTQFAITGLIFYIVFFAIGIGPLFWVICSEIFPEAVRGIGMSMATISNWLSNFVVASTFLLIVETVGLTGTYLLYGLVTLCALYFVKMSVPETKGRSLEEIERLWSVESPPG